MIVIDHDMCGMKSVETGILLTFYETFNAFRMFFFLI